jgi:hypothetical protein
MILVKPYSRPPVANDKVSRWPRCALDGPNVGRRKSIFAHHTAVNAL